MNIRTVTRGASTMTITLVTLGLLASTALAYWTTLGAGSGQATAGTLLAPTGVSANPISGSATSLRVSWSHPSGRQPTSYGVTVGSKGCSVTYPAATCDVTGLTANTVYNDVVVTSLYSTAWTAAATAVTGTTNPAAPGLTITTPADGATGVALNTNFSGGTDATGNVTVQIYPGADNSAPPIGSLTGTVSGTTWSTPPATLPLNNTQYTAVATQSTAGGTTTAKTTFTTAAPTVTDTTGPTNVLSLESASGAHLAGSTLFYKNDVAGNFILVNAMTDSQSGPLSTTFPGISTPNWTHANEVVATPLGGPYKSTAYTWTATAVSPTQAERTITGRDVANNSTASILAFTPDVTAPAGGSVTPSSFSGTVITVSISAPTDAGSGVKGASVTYERQRTTINPGGNCRTNEWANTTTVTLTDSKDTVTTGFCYRYRVASATDNVGNVNTSNAFPTATGTFIKVQ